MYFGTRTINSLNLTDYTVVLMFTKALKNDGALTAEVLECLLRNKCIFDTLSEEWKLGVLITVLKKGNLLNWNNQRGITLPSRCSKLLTWIVLNRIIKPIDDKLWEEQEGLEKDYQINIYVL